MKSSNLASICPLYNYAAQDGDRRIHVCTLSRGVKAKAIGDLRAVCRVGWQRIKDAARSGGARDARDSERAREKGPARKGWWWTDNGSEAEAHVMPVLGNRLWVCNKLGVVEKKKVDQQAGFAAGTYCGAWSASTRYLVLDGDDPCWRSVLEVLTKRPGRAPIVGL